MSSLKQRGSPLRRRPSEVAPSQRQLQPITSQQQPSANVDPRSNLPQCVLPMDEIPYKNFHVLEDCVVHFVAACVVIAGGTDRLLDSRTRVASTSLSGGNIAPFEGVLVVSDSCVYLLDRGAVMERCLPLRNIKRIVAADAIAIDSKARSSIVQLLADAEAMRTKVRLSSLGDGFLCAVGFEQDAVLGSHDYDLLVAISGGPQRLHQLVSVVSRLYWVHCGVQLPLDVFETSSAESGFHAKFIVPTIHDVVVGGGGIKAAKEMLHDPTAALASTKVFPPCLGLPKPAKPAQWTLRVEPMMTWAQLEQLLVRKSRVLYKEEVEAHAEFERLKGLLEEHLTFEDQQRSCQLQRHNEILTIEIEAMSRQLTLGAELLDRFVPDAAKKMRECLDAMTLHRRGVVVSSEEGGALNQTLRSVMPSSMSIVSQLFDANVSYPKRSIEKASSAHNDTLRHNNDGSMSSGRCKRCDDLEKIIESHPNVDKLRCLKAEERVVELQRSLEALQATVSPLEHENNELRAALQDTMTVLLRSGLRDSTTGVASEASLAPCLREALRIGESYHRHSSVDSNVRQQNASISLGDEIKMWRVLVSRMESRHAKEINDLRNAFEEYDRVMLASIAEAIVQYEPTMEVPLPRAAANMLRAAKQRSSYGGIEPDGPSINRQDDADSGYRSLYDQMTNVSRSPLTPRRSTRRADAAVASPAAGSRVVQGYFTPTTNVRWVS